MIIFDKIKNKSGLWWLVFCLVVVVGFNHFYSKSSSHVDHNLYSQGFLEVLGARGHVFEKHIGKSDEYLQDRLNGEQISAASTFNDVVEAENAIRIVLMKRSDLVQAWVKSGRSNKKAFYWRMEEPVGRILRRGWGAPKAGNQTRVVLARDLQNYQKFIILTAYPEFK